MSPRAAKRQDLLAGGLTLFARDGYTRASVDAIAEQAGVSTRTLYNHFGDKAGLFQAVIAASSAEVADRHIAIIERHLGDVSELEPALVALGLDWGRRSAEDLSEHWALVRQVSAERDHIPEAALRAWREAGPLAVRRALAARLAELAPRFGLDLPDPELAARHLLQLIAADDFPGGAGSPAHEAVVRTGARVFLRGYAGEG
ncbi:TetR/AcrR family transcriptional regulator [Nocardioides nitrophenolicus]|uniref:TetR/AcrR family transcriptional regulator n=1 Tax=Nocardioides nitrophenolicus TaxID=60489 RepID=UPI00195F75DC|nr:TetR/AcrR family transcriptional regulator [Nocardioides nitrophenolicus]MBM7520465.1 AcrR family transcriptional regulator [Nocardioides nitrophenolicus]